MLSSAENQNGCFVYLNYVLRPSYLRLACFDDAYNTDLSFAARFTPPQDGTADEDALWDAVMVDADTSVIAVGHTQGGFSGVFAGGAVDVVVVKLDAATGVETWRYQVWLVGLALQYPSPLQGAWRFGLSRSSRLWAARLVDKIHHVRSPFVSPTASLRVAQAGTATGADYFKAIAATEDGGVVVNGDTEGNWSGASAGDKDFVAVKLRSGPLNVSQNKTPGAFTTPTL